MWLVQRLVDGSNEKSTGKASSREMELNKEDGGDGNELAGYIGASREGEGIPERGLGDGGGWACGAR